MILAKEYLVMDTCVLLPYLVKLCWEQQLDKVCGNLAQEDAGDYLQSIKLMERIIDATGKKVVITPHILMELEALAESRLGRDSTSYALFKRKMNAILLKLNERFVRKEDILGEGMAMDFGYADTSIVKLQQQVKNSFILSNELPLVSLCRAKDVPALSLDEFVSTSEVAEKL
jgi:rRNA-processing protein FCF1